MGYFFGKIILWLLLNVQKDKRKKFAYSTPILEISSHCFLEYLLFDVKFGKNSFEDKIQIAPV